MLEYVGGADPISPFSVTARPDSIAGRPALLASMALLVPVCTLTGLGFILIGAWPVAVCIALHIGAVLATFRYVERHTRDFERLTLADDRLILDTHTPDEDRHVEFNGYWVQVDLQTSAEAGGSRLCLRSHGKEVPFGLLMSDAERRAVSQELGRRLARLRH